MQRWEQRRHGWNRLLLIFGVKASVPINLELPTIFSILVATHSCLSACTPAWKKLCRPLSRLPIYLNSRRCSHSLTTWAARSRPGSLFPTHNSAHEGSVRLLPVNESVELAV